MRRTVMLFKAFFTGIVDDFSGPTLEAMLKKWQKLKGKDEFLRDVKQQSVARRKSMFETATRSNYLLVVAAFVIAANVALIVAPGGSIASQVLQKISTSMVALAAAILIIAISAKSKVMKRPREGGEVEPAEMLDTALRAEETTTSDHDMVKWERVKRESNRLHKRKIILVVERRAQWIPAMLMATGLLVFIVGVCVR